jgi:hypothetical protein
MHRYYNEIPSIKKQVANINRDNNEVVKLLTKQEAFKSAPINIRDTSSGKRGEGELIIRGPTNKLHHKEGFEHGCPKDNILSIILWVSFVVLVGSILYAYYIRKKNKLATRAMYDYDDWV